jgi:hypothetical protein
MTSTHPSPSRLPALVLLAVFAALVVACGSTSSSADSSGTSPSGSSGATTPSSSVAVVHPRREYPAGGPTDPVFPPGDQAYALITSNRCTELLDDTTKWDAGGVPGVEGADTTPLYVSAAYVCLGRWDDAQTSYRQIDAAHPDFTNHVCDRTAVLQWVTAMLDERAKDPTFAPVFVASAAPSPCPPDGSTDTSADGSDGAGSTTTDPAAASTTTTR